MAPLTLQIAESAANILNGGSALQNAIAALQISRSITLPSIPPTQVVLSSAGPAVLDIRQQIPYPRVSIYVPQMTNSLLEKFRSFSGTAGVGLIIAASDQLVQSVEQELHYYLEIISGILRESAGDWGNGIFFGGAYDVEMLAPEVGGLGFVQTATITCHVNVSRS